MIRRPRRLRVTKQIRDLVHETSIDKTDLIYPMFIIDGETEDIPSMPNIKRYSLTDLPSALDEVVSAGVGAVLYFGIPKTKDEFGSEAYNEFGIVQRAIRLTKELYRDSFSHLTARFNRNCRHLSLRVHFTRSLRCYRTRLYRQRQDFTAFSKSVGGLCKSRCGYCCTVGYDGRTSRCNTSGT